MMTMRYLRIVLLSVFSICTIRALPALAHGDKVIPQVPDGPGFRTKFDITNLGPDPATAISKVTVLFFRQNGSAWTIATNLGTSSSFTLNLGAFQTIRLETLGQSTPDTSGYAIVRNLEATNEFAEDYQVAITVFYEVRNGGAVVDTVSVPVGQPTVAFVIPVQIEDSQSLFTGFAIVNLARTSNTVKLQLWKSESPSSRTATDGGSGTLTLGPGEQKALFLYPSIFPNQSNFKGMALGICDSDKPVAILALLQTSTGTGVQYATMVPAYADALRRNTYMYLRQGSPLDVDLPASDYFGNSQDTAPWDLLYVTDSDTRRHIEARSGAAFAILGVKTNAQFDSELTIETLRGLNYSTTSIDLSDNSPNLALQFAFAVRTGLGRYAKVRIADYITRATTNRDLAVEMYVYK